MAGWWQLKSVAASHGILCRGTSKVFIRASEIISKGGIRGLRGVYESMSETKKSRFHGGSVSARRASLQTICHMPALPPALIPISLADWPPLRASSLHILPLFLLLRMLYARHRPLVAFLVSA
jgi:hypothetical protein